MNIAALMESTSEPMKIQISQTTQELLQELGGFKTEIRGQMQVPRIGQVSVALPLFFHFLIGSIFFANDKILALRKGY